MDGNYVNTQYDNPLTNLRPIPCPELARNTALHFLSKYLSSGYQ